MPKTKDKLDKMKRSIILGCLANGKKTKDAINREIFQGLAILQLFVEERGLWCEFEEFLNELAISLKLEAKQSGEK